MKKKLTIIPLLLFISIPAFTEIVEKTFFFSTPEISSDGIYQTVNFGNTLLSGINGEPLLPWHEVMLMLPPGESAVSVALIEEEETVIPGAFLLKPKQPVQPVSFPASGGFEINSAVYAQTSAYPACRNGRLMTQYLGGYALALCTFTPVRYLPAGKQLSYFKKVTVRIHTRSDVRSDLAMRNLPDGRMTVIDPRKVVMNPEVAVMYPRGKSPATGYDYLVVCPPAFKNEFQPLISMYGGIGMLVRVIATDSIYAVATGIDDPEKIRNFIIAQRQNEGISFVLLAGNPPLVPYRGFYCSVQSSSVYVSSNIPADLYFSGLDGNFDADNDHIYAEVNDDPDLLPDIAVARFTVSDTAGLHRMIRKTVQYQTNPVLGELTRPLMAGEWLYGNPLTYSGPYMELLIDDHADHGYFTHGIPSAQNQIQKLYDSPTFTWTAPMLLTAINQGRSFLHHLGHASATYMMKMYMADITDANFSQVNGVTHNFQLLYTQGCNDGAFDTPGGCIAGKAVSINNFLVAGVFNSRYGWFNEGTTNGPSQHLHREFISALYHDTLPERHLGAAHMISKIKTASWIGLPGEFEPGAQRWVHYDCNAFGDPALAIWTSEPETFIPNTWTGEISSDWNDPQNWSRGRVPTSLSDVTIAEGTSQPVISVSNTAFCHNLVILDGGNLTIQPGKSLVVYGTVTMGGE